MDHYFHTAVVIYVKYWANHFSYFDYISLVKWYRYLKELMGYEYPGEG